jgi:hypothetical protein
MSIKPPRYLAKAILTTFAVGLFFAVILLLENGYFDSVFKKLGVYPMPEAYTALFFTDVEKLTAEFESTQSLKKLTFGVYNHENVDQNYDFIVTVKADDEILPITNGTLFANPGETVYSTIELDVNDYPTNSIVYVTIPAVKKSIDFKIK